MPETEISSVYYISNKHPAVKVELGVRVAALPGRKLYSAISLPPGNLSGELLDILWQPTGLCPGVHAAFSDTQFPFDTSAVEVTFTQLDVSSAWDEFTEDELRILADKLEALVRDTVKELLQNILAELNDK